MQHSVKFVLNDTTSFARVSASFPQATDKPLMIMEDSFLDTANGLLSKNKIILRVRRNVQARTSISSNSNSSETNPPTAEVRAMQHSTVTDGCAQRWDTSAELDPRVAEKIFLLPGDKPVVFGELLDRLMASCGEFLEKIITTATGKSLNITKLKFQKLGGYRTVRDTRPWLKCNSQPGLNIRIDQTTYPFGERYELEVPDITVPVEDVIEELSDKLESIGAKFQRGHQTKWQVFVAAQNSESVKNQMAVAAKIEVQTAADFETVRRSLGGLPPDSEHDEPFGELQENYFFDTADGQLRKRNIVFRLRILPQKNKAFVTIKENEPVTGGSAVSWMQQESIPIEVVKSAIQDPSSFFLHPSSAAQKIQTALLTGRHPASQASPNRSQQQQQQSSQGSTMNNNNNNGNSNQGIISNDQNENSNQGGGVRTPAKPGSCVPSQDNFPTLVFVGGYHNRRESFVWPGCQSQPGLTINLDRTKYSFGERYELEVPGISVPVHDVVGELGEILTKMNVSYRPSASDKMQIMLDGVSKVGNAKNAVPPPLARGNLYAQQNSSNNYYNGPQRVLDDENKNDRRRQRQEVGDEEGDLF